MSLNMKIPLYMDKRLIFSILMIGLLLIPIGALAATEEEIEDAIALGVEYLADQQNDDGSWGPIDSYVNTAETGLVLIKLQMRAYELGFESPFDAEYEYSDNVELGWSFIFDTDDDGNPLYALDQELSDQDHTGGASGTVDEPDTNGNGYGIYFDNPWPFYQVYTTGICLMALQASGTPDRVNDGGIDYNGDTDADTFMEIAQDAADWLAWAQGDSGNDEGGWGYGALNNQGGSDQEGPVGTDNSNSGYAVLGLAAAEGFGCTIPDWVRTELNVWITTIQDPVNGDPDDGGSYYNPDWLPGDPWCNELKTGNLIFQMTFFGDSPTDTRFMDAMDYIERHWQDMNNDPGWGYGIDLSNYQAMFCLMKGLAYSRIVLIDLDDDGVPEHDWYEEFAEVLVNQQIKVDPDSTPNSGDEYGYWYMGGYGDSVIDTAWALLTLERIIPPITVYVDIKPSSWPNPINVGSKGVFAVAICGTEDFDVMTIDPATVRILVEGIEEGVSPIRWSYEDVATPYTGPLGGGHALRGDGYLDLVFHFDTQVVVATLTLTGHVGEIIPLTITGNLREESHGTAIIGQDFVRILSPMKGK